MATMKQIADLSGVSRGTVDRVLNNRGGVNEETAKKVRDIAQSLNYVPSKAAKSLAARKLALKLGYVLFPYESNSFFRQVEDGIEKKAADLAEYGVRVEIAHSDFGDPESQDEVLDRFLADGVRGIVICGFNTQKTSQRLKDLSLQGIPVVTANTDIPGSGRIAYVGSDYEKCGRTAGNLMRLITGGHAHVGILLGSRNMLCHTERVNGFTSYLKETAKDITICDIRENFDDDFESFSIVREMMSGDSPIDALYLASAGVYGACRAVEGLPENRRPKIICFDCLPTTREMLKKGIICATICSEPERQGSEPLDILFNYIGMGITPPVEYNFTNIDIVVKESL